MKRPSPTAALSGVTAGIQARGPWMGRMQLFVRFASEAETATMYTADALGGEVTKLLGRVKVQALAVIGRDVLGQAPFLAALFHAWSPTLPVLLDTDGQRPDALPDLRKYFSMVQVTSDFIGPDVLRQNAVETLAVAGQLGVDHSLVLLPHDKTSDAEIIRIVEQAHRASPTTIVVVHPPLDEQGSLSRRWAVLLEKALAFHDDVRILLKVPAPVGMR